MNQDPSLPPSLPQASAYHDVVVLVVLVEKHHSVAERQYVARDRCVGISLARARICGAVTTSRASSFSHAFTEKNKSEFRECEQKKKKERERSRRSHLCPRPRGLLTSASLMLSASLMSSASEVKLLAKAQHVLPLFCWPLRWHCLESMR